MNRGMPCSDLTWNRVPGTGSEKYKKGDYGHITTKRTGGKKKSKD